MALQAPPQTPASERPAPPPTSPDRATEAGVIEDARKRQRRHRWIGSLLAAAAATALLAGMAVGGGGSGSGHGRQAGSSGSGAAGGSAHVSANTTFPGAPASQPNGYGVETNLCPLAARNRYLPPRVGCVSVRHADLNGDGRADLIITYSTLGRRHSTSSPDEPPKLRTDLPARAAFLRVVLAGGTSLTTRIPQSRLSHAVAIVAIAHVGAGPGDEIFLQTMRISSGGTIRAYGFHAGRLVSAGVQLGFGGDSADVSGFNCLPGNPPRVVQRTYSLIGPTIYAWWTEHVAVYAWHGPRLVPIASRSFRHHGKPPNSAARVGRGCLHGV